MNFNAVEKRDSMKDSERSQRQKIADLRKEKFRAYLVALTRECCSDEEDISHFVFLKRIEVLKRLRRAGMSYKELMELTGWNQNHLRLWINRKTWDPFERYFPNPIADYRFLPRRQATMRAIHAIACILEAGQAKASPVVGDHLA